MSFICGGAQSESLEKIWDVLRESVILPVNVGDRFDSDFSRAQGKVAQLFVPGFRNDYKCRIIRKSNVHAIKEIVREVIREQEKVLNFPL